MGGEYIKTGLRIISYGLELWLVFALVMSTVPYISQKKVGEEKKQEFASMGFYSGNDGPGPDRALVIESPGDAFGIRMELIRSAQYSLDISTHMIKDSETTQAFLGEIIAAADRGVQVRLLVDSKSTFANGVITGYLKAMDAHSNIACKIYNPITPFSPWRWHALLHDKFIIVDETFLLLGGRNVDERHFAPAGYERPVTHDRDVLVWRVSESEGENRSGIDQTMDYMDLLWEYELSKPVASRPIAGEKGQKQREALNSAIALLEEKNPLFYEKTLENYLAATVETARITLIYNPIEATAKEPWIGWQLGMLALEAEKSVVVQTPYATGNKKLLALMVDVADGRKLALITNSMASSPNIAAFSNYYGQRQKFIAAGAEIYEYQQRDSIHGKSLVIDDRLSAVGSLNLDDRSFYLDTETMLVIDSPQFAAQLLGVMGDIKYQCLQVGPDNQYLPSISPGVDALKTTVFKAAAMKAAYVLLRPFQFLI